MTVNDDMIAESSDLSGRGALRHRREVFARNGSYWPLCSCGWMGVGEMSWAGAASAACEVEDILAWSQERRRRIVSEQR
mgnify:CR=1 FL=1